ncbi:shikimate kinase [Myroides sp. LJL119]
MKKIVLVGYMGSGKSTIGVKLAEQLNLPFFDLDQQIEKQYQTTISKIFQEKGEIYFRKLEHITLNNLLEKQTPMIISLGGGTPCYANNHESLQRDDVCSIYLKASIQTLANRLEKEKEHRPLIYNHNEDTLETFIAKHLFDRSYFYYQAKKILDIDNKTISQIVQEIIDLSN